MSNCSESLWTTRPDLARGPRPRPFPLDGEVAALLASPSRPHSSVVLNLLIRVDNGWRSGDPPPALPGRYAEGGQAALRCLETDLAAALASPPPGVQPARLRALLGAVRGFREEVLAWPTEPAHTARP